MKLYSNIFYWADAKKRDEAHVTEFKRQTFPIFDRFYVYNVDQISGEYTDIVYLNNCRLVDKIWYINSFRDMAAIVSNTNDYINTGQPNVAGSFNDFESPKEDTTMFTDEVYQTGSTSTIPSSGSSKRSLQDTTWVLAYQQ